MFLLNLIKDLIVIFDKYISYVKFLILNYYFKINKIY